MKANDFVKKLITISEDYPTLYVYGAIGCHLRSDNVSRYINKYTYNQKADRTDKINAHLDLGIFGFDCVCLIKSVLWGWNGNLDAPYGGAVYKSNGVPDVSADGMLKLCTEVSRDFSSLLPGEFLWMKGHCGIYIGDGLAVECSPKWRDGVQITRVSGMDVHPEHERIYTNERKWTKHGKLPFIDYTDDTAQEPDFIPETTPDTDKEAEKTKTENVFLRLIFLALKIIKLFFKG